jgi:predicted phage-related endonuclease
MTAEILTTPPGARLHPLREKDITASNIGALFGVDPYTTVFDLWARKAGLASPPEENDAMRLGRWCEPIVPIAIHETWPGRFQIDYPLGVYVHDEELRFGGTPDARGTDHNEPCVFEFKVISRQSYERGGWDDDNAPPAYVLQTLTNAMLLDVPKGILAALVFGFSQAELVLREIPRHAGAEAEIVKRVRNFWEAFDEGHAPRPDYSRDAEVIRQVFRPDKAVPVPLDLTRDNRIATLLEQHEMLAAAERAAKAEREAIDAEIRTKLNGATLALADGWKITNNVTHYKEKVREAYDSARLIVTRLKEKVA